MSETKCQELSKKSVIFESIGNILSTLESLNTNIKALEKHLNPIMVIRDNSRNEPPKTESTLSPETSRLNKNLLEIWRLLLLYQRTIVEIKNKLDL